MSKFWNFKNIASGTDKENIELRIDGDFIDSEDAWIYEWFGIPVASPNAFRRELSQYAGKNITVWINSYGGSVFAAAGIYNALMEHKKSGAKVTTKADSKVMSAATIPYMAGDERLMGPMDIFMMHNPLTNASGYASDLRKVAEVLDTVKETIINAYQLGTGLTREKISSMMDDETYMSANRAVKDGFATDILYPVSKNEGNQDDVMNFAFSHMAIQNSATDSMKKIMEVAKKVETSAQQAQASKPQPDANINNVQEGDTPMFKDVKELRDACPELVKQIEDAAREEGKNSERIRIQDIEKISKNITPDLVNKAKFEEPMDAKELAFQAMQHNAGKGQNYLKNANQDSNDSGTNNVTAAPLSQSTEEEKKAAENKAADNIAAGGNRRRGK